MLVVYSRRGLVVAQIFRADETFSQSLFAGASCAFGVFDGVHKGHQYLIDCAKQSAQSLGGRSLVLTFDIDPDEVFRPDKLKKLMTNEDRIATLAKTGVDAVVVLPFTLEFAASTPEEFLRKTFGDTTPASLHVGYDFKFGARAKGTVEDLRQWGHKHAVTIDALGLKSEDGAPISATRIRQLLSEGDITEANRLLGHTYFVGGVVQPGRGEGADMGFRTANLEIPSIMRALGDGVYAAWATVDSKRYKAAVNVGVPATFAERSRATCEVHLLDFKGDLYGQTIRVEFLHWLRPMRKFDDIDELIATVQGNIAWVRENL